MNIQALETLLQKRLALPLPGTPSQVVLAPSPRIGWRPGHLPPEARPGAALLLIYPHGEQPHLLLTVRNGDLPQHPGQVSFPGGAVESGETLEHAALREAHEECGVEPADVRLLGELTPLHVPVSGFVLNVFVGIADRQPIFRTEAREVARLLEIPLHVLEDPSRFRSEQRVLGSKKFDVPYIALDGEKVWGATAMILAEFLALIGSPPPDPTL